MHKDSKTQETMASADARSQDDRTQTFKEYMSDLSVDNVQDFLDAMSDHGLPADNLTFLDDEDADESCDMLADQLEVWSFILRAKAKGFRALRDEGFEAIKAEADMGGVVHYTPVYETVATGEWCRRDGVVYVSYGGVETTTIAMWGGRKRYRDRNDRENAARVLELLYDHGLDEDNHDLEADLAAIGGLSPS